MWHRGAELVGTYTPSRVRVRADKSRAAVKTWLYNRDEGLAHKYMRTGVIKPGVAYVRVRDAADRSAVLERGSKRDGHMGIIIAQQGEWLYTIDGNTNDHGLTDGEGGDSDRQDANGGGVFQNKISIYDDRLVGFVRPGFELY
jgi:hypothetical protein